MRIDRLWKKFCLVALNTLDSEIGYLRIVDRARERYKFNKERDTKRFMELDHAAMSRTSFYLLLVFIPLTFGDALLTVYGWHAFPVRFLEFNPIAARLLNGNFEEFLLLLPLKYGAAIPIFYGVFAKESRSYPLQSRIVKLSVLVALVVVDSFYAGIVAANTFALALASG